MEPRPDVFIPIGSQDTLFHLSHKYLSSRCRLLLGGNHETDGPPCPSGPYGVLEETGRYCLGTVRL